MGQTLVIVESPSKANKIQSFLGDDYIVLASYGHITDLSKKNMGIDIEKGFKPHYVLMDDKVEVLQKIINAAKQSDLVLLFSDADREGFAISWHIKERLDGIKAPIKRGIFNEITKKAFLKGASEAGDIDMNIVKAQETRRILDRLVGFLVSPFLINTYGPKLSGGRVQSVVTRMIIDREREIESFIPEDFWTIQTKLSANNETFTAKYTGKITDQLAANNAKQSLDVSDYIVSEVLSQEEKKYPQAPLVTSTLQRIMSKTHGFGADKTMKAAQALYEAGYCTYIRTDSVRIGDEAIKDVRQWLLDSKFDVPKKQNLYKNKDAAQDAHECIRPSDLTIVPNQNFAIIDPAEKLVYETIWKHFIASQMMPAIYDTLSVTAHPQNNPKFKVKASGKALKYKGYQEVLGIEDVNSIDIPLLTVGQIIKNLNLKMDKKQTQPSPRFSEDKLIKELVNKNIGRPATYADLLSKITTRNYVEKKGNVYYATDLGKKITDVLIKYFTFMDYNFTSELEKKLDDIEQGKINNIDVLKKFYAELKKEIDIAYLNNNGTLCEKCSSPMSIKTSKSNNQKFLACSAYPRCHNTKPIS